MSRARQQTRNNKQNRKGTWKVDIGSCGGFVVIGCERCEFVVAANACLQFHFIAR